jgi:membrane-associated PAP2 superfamily phosphatase
MRGAHYLSHSLWTAWVCWAVCVLATHAPRLRRIAPAAGELGAAKG